MKICHICTGNTLSFQGGITNYVRALAESQHKKGNEVWVIAGMTKERYDYHVKEYRSNKIYTFTLRAMEDREGLYNIKEFIDKQQFDIIHLHMLLDVDWNLFEVLKPYKYVVSLHDYFYLCPRIQMMQPNYMLCKRYDRECCSKCVSWFDTNRLFAYGERFIQKRFGWRNFRLPTIRQHVTHTRFQKMKQLLENAQILLPVSTRVQQIYEDSGIAGNYKMLHIGNITADNFVPSFNEKETEDTLNVIMLGSLNYIKGADLFVKLAKSLDRTKFSVHFYGKSGDYKVKSDEAGIIDHGPYNQNELPKLLMDADIGCVLSVWEDNGPQVVMEMLNNHVPVVGTRMGGIPDFVEDGVNGFLFDPYAEGDFEKLVERLNALTRDDIITLKRNIKPTTTTVEHANAIAAVYREVVEQ